MSGDANLTKNIVDAIQNLKKRCLNSGYDEDPTFTFMGIVKSQMYRLRRLCSRDEDYKDAIQNLKKRCLNSGYDEDPTFTFMGIVKSQMYNQA